VEFRINNSYQGTLSSIFFLKNFFSTQDDIILWIGGFSEVSIYVYPWHAGTHRGIYLQITLQFIIDSLNRWPFCIILLYTQYIILSWVHNIILLYIGRYYRPVRLCNENEAWCDTTRECGIINAKMTQNIIIYRYDIGRGTYLRIVYIYAPDPLFRDASTAYILHTHHKSEEFGRFNIVLDVNR